MSPDAVKPISIAILAMGGEGGGVLADWIVDLAEHAGYCAQTTSVPGVAQRTGATIYYVEFYPVRLTGSASEPILALAPVAGDVDIVLCSELMEAGRAVQRGIVTPDRTTLLTSTHRIYSMTEKTAMGDGRVDSARLLQAGRDAAKRFIAADFAALAEQTGSVMSAVLFGALAGAEVLPFRREAFEAAIERGGVGVKPSLKAFDAGFLASKAQEGTPSLEPTSVSGASAGTFLPDARLADLDARIRVEFPTQVHAILQAGVRRLADYQDVAYSDEYLDALLPVAQIEGHHHGTSWELLSETARHLALWMSYEDTVRVADLKIRGGRFARVAREVKVAPDQLLHINEFLHPRVDEIADTLPAGIGRWLMKPGWARRLVERYTQRGRIVRTSSLAGFLQLYAVASLRGTRRCSLRYLREMRAWREWLSKIAELAPMDYALAVEVARCQRLVKGYGDTHARGMRNFSAIMAALPALCRSGGASMRVREACEAALADDSGKRLTDLLGQWCANAPDAERVSPSRELPQAVFAH